MTMRGDSIDDPTLSRAIPVLERGRLLKAIVFDKSAQKKKNMHDYDKAILTAAIGVSKCSSLMLAGGWVYPEIRQDLQAMFYNYRAMVENLDYNVVAAAMVQDLPELGFDQSLINLQQTIPNMDTILKIFLEERDYYEVRQELDAFLASEDLSALDADFLTDRPADKSMVVNLFPITEQFDTAEPGNFGDLPEHEKPKPHGYHELGEIMSRAMSKLIDGNEIRFKVSENDYRHHLDRAVQGIKDSIITDLSTVVRLVLPETAKQPNELIPILQETLGPEVAAPTVKWLNRYHAADEEYQIRNKRMLEVTGVESKVSTIEPYKAVLLRNPIQNEV
jgi:hypothetical protein